MPNFNFAKVHLIINIRLEKTVCIFERLWRNPIVRAGYNQAVFRQRIGARNLTKGIFKKIQDMKQSVPMDNTGLINGWL